MIILFFRHGDRMAGNDPTLSAIGYKQAANLPQFLEQNQISLPDVLWVSPRKRAQESFEILAREKNLPCEIRPELDERTGKESAVTFRQRVQGVINRLPHTQKNIFICSHMDWLEEAMTCIPDQGKISLETFVWPVGGFIEFEIVDNLWTSTRQGQVLP